MEQGPTEQQPDTRGIVLRGLRQILSVTLRTTASPRSVATAAAPWSTLPDGTNLEFRGEFLNPLNHPNCLFAKSGPQSGNNSSILGTPQFGVETAARGQRQIQLALKFCFDAGRDML